VTDEIVKLRKALEFYADVSKYPAPFTGGMGALWYDCGNVARDALAGAVTERYKHVKRGTEYDLIGVGRMQAEDWCDMSDAFDDGEGLIAGTQDVDMREVSIYRSVDDGMIWVRPLEEFNDGRFVRVSV
jgi:hypothetical protein